MRDIITIIMVLVTIFFIFGIGNVVYQYLFVFDTIPNIVTIISRDSISSGMYGAPLFYVYDEDGNKYRVEHKTYDKYFYLDKER